MTRHGSHTESRMRENCTYGSMRGIRRKTAKHVLRVAEGRAGVPHGASRSTLHHRKPRPLAPAPRSSTGTTDLVKYAVTKGALTMASTAWMKDKDDRAVALVIQPMLEVKSV